ncbi:MAG: formate dehydrogenase accessory sulfurtransferase FdhD [Chloroflexi bacterium]|nr:formate dehydrogenase accessory sulfurtransferase FdhD [Chloroflexota bacterium]
MNAEKGALNYIHVNNGRAERVAGAIIGETRWTLFVNRRELVSFMCTPTNLHYLALGFLHSEGIIRALDDVLQMRVYEDVNRSYWYQPALGLNGSLPMRTCEESVGVIDVRVKGEPTRELGPRILTSGCTGGVTFDDLSRAQPRLTSDYRVELSKLFQLMRQLNEQASLYKICRGVHTSGLGTEERLQVVAEDVGRHNTLDKIRGECLMRGIDTRDKILIATGRISSEMLTKAAKMGVPVVVSRTSPTWLAVRLAEAWGIAVCGYTRGPQTNIYTHSERIVIDRATGARERAIAATANGDLGEAGEVMVE